MLSKLKIDLRFPVSPATHRVRNWNKRGRDPAGAAEPPAEEAQAHPDSFIEESDAAGVEALFSNPRPAYSPAAVLESADAAREAARLD